MDKKETGQERDEKLKRLFNVIMTVDAPTREKIVSQLDAETVTALRSMKNPLKLPVVGGSMAKSLGFYVHNLRAEYWEKFYMTAISAWFHRMADEYEPEDMMTQDDGSELMSEESPEFTETFHKLLRVRIRELSVAKRRRMADDPTLPDDERRRQELSIYWYQIRANKDDIALYVTKKEAIERKVADENASIRADEADRKKMEEELGYKRLLATKVEEAKRGANAATNVTEADGRTGQISVAEMAKKVVPKAIRGAKRFNESNIAQYEEMIKKNLERTTEILPESIAIRQDEIDKLTAVVDKLTAVNAELHDAGSALAKKYGYVGKELSLPVEDHEPDAEEVDAVVQEAKKKLNYHYPTKEEYVQRRRCDILKFLSKYLEYNPDQHVRSNYYPGYLDKVALANKLPPELTDEEKRKQLVEMKKYELVCVPPKDTFHRLNFYVSNNLEQLRQATDDIYGLDPGAELMIAPMVVFEGDETARQKQYDTFKMRYSKEMDTDLKVVNFGHWTMLGSWKENRDKTDVFSRQTELLKRMVDAQKDNTAIGAELVKDRARRKKAENEKKVGKADDSFADAKEYLKMGKDAEKLGASAASSTGKSSASSGTSSSLAPEDVPRDDRDSTSREVEVGVTKIRPVYDLKKKHIPMRGLSSAWKFNVPTQDFTDISKEVVVKAPPKQ